MWKAEVLCVLCLGFCFNSALTWAKRQPGPLGITSMQFCVLAGKCCKPNMAGGMNKLKNRVHEYPGAFSLGFLHQKKDIVESCLRYYF